MPLMPGATRKCAGPPPTTSAQWSESARYTAGPTPSTAGPTVSGVAPAEAKQPPPGWRFANPPAPAPQPMASPPQRTDAASSSGGPTAAELQRQVGHLEAHLADLFAEVQDRAGVALL